MNATQANHNRVWALSAPLERVSFDMVERDGFWYVAGEPWPHFRFNC